MKGLRITIMKKPTLEEIDDVLQILASIPIHIAALTGMYKNDLLTSKPDPESWSANEILAHLRACADVWGDTIQKMLTEDNPTLPHISPCTWLRNTNYRKIPFNVSFDAYGTQRSKLLGTLIRLDSEAWSRGAVIKDRQHTIFSQASRMGQHDIDHVNQIKTLLEILTAKPGNKRGV